MRLVVLSTQEYGRRQQFGAPAEFVGTDNFAEIFGSPYFWDVLWRSLLFCAVNVVFTLVLGTLLALLLERLGTVMRTALSVALLLAWATPALTATIVWQWIFDARYGVVNWVLTGLAVTSRGIRGCRASCRSSSSPRSWSCGWECRSWPSRCTQA